MTTFRKTPFTVHVRDLIGRPGEMREHRLDIDAPEQYGEGIVAVRQGAPIDVDVRVESVHEGILASVEVSAEAVGECSRCLTDISLPVDVEFQELFAYSSDEAFDYEVHDDHVDLEPLVRDAVVLSLPFQPVCRPDCPGLDPVTGERLADSSEREPDAPHDPRWAALAGLSETGNGGAAAPGASADSGAGRQAGTETD
ncbi:YceD family protein [Rathayibacter sp. Leaf299]|uniref:YceD family protein n=1 Tax=Rathayibacter sp. Leaf299 TaxID=1736328 RepID=UPI000AEFA6C2|nr:YceD family protein [Rathayibacter sp. Leaf299]